LSVAQAQVLGIFGIVYEFLIEPCLFTSGRPTLV
jgi:hypothetical protein